MALTPEQKSSRLFKKSFGASETLLARDFFEEPKLGNTNILPLQIWSEADSIPGTAPTLSNGQTQGVVKYYELLELTHVAGSQDLSYYNDSLKDAIPFNYGDGTYNYALYKNDGTTQIAFGEGDWLLDTSAGVLTFYGTLPSSVSSSSPPKISFYQYVGEKGLGSVTGATSGINVKDPVIAATTGQTDATYSTATSGFTSLPSNVDGVISFNDGDRILIKDQTNGYENGIYEVSGSTLIRAYDHDGTPVGEVGVNDYCFVTSGNTNIAKSFVLGSTDAEDQNIITPGIDSQNWKLFSEGLAYTTNGQAIKLNGTTFSLDLDDTSGNSGLYQSVDGLRLDTSITNAITGNTNNIISIENQIINITGDTISLETEIINNTNNITSIENNITTITGDTSSLEDVLSTEISTTNSEVTSLSTAIGNVDFTSLENEITGNTSEIVSLSTELSSEISTTDSEMTSLESVVTTLSGSTMYDATNGLTNNGGVAELGGNLTKYTQVGTNGNLLNFNIGSESASEKVTMTSPTDGGLGSVYFEHGEGKNELGYSSGDQNQKNIVEVSNQGTFIRGKYLTTEGYVKYDYVSQTLQYDVDRTSTLENNSLVHKSYVDSLTTSGNTSLETALSTEISTTDGEITSLETALDNFSGVTETTAGSGLTYLSGNQSLNVNVDDYTIKIVNDELRTPETWIETDKTTTITSGSGATNIQLDYEPVGYVSAFINGIEYIVNPTPGSSATDMPFFFNEIPVQGSTLYFDADEVGFGLESGVDLITVKYSYISLV